MFKKKYLFLALVISLFSWADAVKIKEWNFNNIKEGSLPSGFVAHTGGGIWEVLNKGANNSDDKIIVLHKMDKRLSQFNLLFTKDVAFKDGQISVKFRADSGHIDQGGGLMWRVQDKENYYVARFNPLEDNFRFYIVKDGNRRELASRDVKLASGWHTMTIMQNGNDFTASLDDKVLLKKSDNQLKKSGGIGLWTKADAATSFDDLKVK